MVKRIIILIVWHAFVKAFVVVDWAHIKCEIMKKNVFNTLGDNCIHIRSRYACVIKNCIVLLDARLQKGPRTMYNLCHNKWLLCFADTIE